jgi:TRAP-type C4-dicarboxylate transport system permease small subunit
MAEEERPSTEPPASSKGKAVSSPWPSAHKSAPPASAPVHVENEKAAWGAPLARFDRVWTTFETRLCAAVLVLEVALLVFWIALRAMSSTGSAGPGMIFRALLAALVCGGLTWWLSPKVIADRRRREVVTTAATLLGLVLGTQWGDAGRAYFGNFFAWLQNASILVFFGGASDLAKRLTLWLALLGASLATAQGKHINVDVVMRFLSPRARVPVAVIGWVAAAVVSITASWGFFDYVCVEELHSQATMPCPRDATKRCQTPPGAKVDAVMAAVKRDSFLAGRQLSLDLHTLPKIIAGTPYNKFMRPADWNAWLRDGGWEKHFAPADVKAFEVPEDGTIEFRNPAVTAIPGASEAIPKLLVPLFDMVFAFGLLVIGVRFVLRSLLALAGWVKVDPAAAHGDDELAQAHDGSVEAKLADAATKETHA